MTVFIGDVHGHFTRYEKLIKQYPNSIQVGDMGVGFVSPYGIPFANPPYDKMVETNARFIRGNHDNPSVCRKHTQCIADGHVENGVMFIGGAFSIDKDFRTLNEDYWEEEELSYMELDGMVEAYKNIKPRVMVTHDCPEVVSEHLFANTGKLNIPSRTRQAYDVMWEAYKPEIWIFGHWHQSRDVVIMDTRFVCLAELEVKD
jgi:Icc-related predicted phosphoesterase